MKSLDYHRNKLLAEVVNLLDNSLDILFALHASAHCHAKVRRSCVAESGVDSTDTMILIFTNILHEDRLLRKLLEVKEDIGVEGTICVIVSKGRCCLV